MTTKERSTATSGSNVTRLEYDPLGNLVTVTLPNGDLIRYSSDGAGRRVGRRLNGVWTGGWVYTNALQVAADLDGTGAVVNRYVYGGDSQTPDLILNGTHTYRVIRDQLGSVRGVVDASDGTVAQQIGYDAWGVPTVVSGGTFQALGYAGGLSDQATGLVRFGARDYDPVAGRWTCKDPVASTLARGSLYEYTFDSPLDDVDPVGLSASGTAVPGLHLALSPLDIDARKQKVIRKLKSSDLPEPVQNAYRHAYMSHYIKCKYGLGMAITFSILQEGLSTEQFLRDLPNHPDALAFTKDTATDLENDISGLASDPAYVIAGRGGLYDKPGVHLPPTVIPPQFKSM